MALPAGMQAHEDDPVLRLFFALEIDLPASPLLPAKTLRLLDGSGVVSWNGMTFLGQDGDYGGWLKTDPIEESLATEAPKFAVTLGPVSDEAMQQIGQPVSQSSAVTVYGGYLDPVTLQPVATPETVWSGMLDIGDITLATNQRMIEVDVYCYAELFMLEDDGSKLNSAWHQQFFPGETGFGFVDSVTHPVPWGAAGPRPDQAISGRNYSTAQNSGGGKTSLRF